MGAGGRGEPPSSSSYSLGVDLADIGQSLGQGIARHLVTILVSELGRVALRPLSESSGIGYGPRHDATDRGRDLEDVRDRRGINKLVLVFWSAARLATWPGNASRLPPTVTHGHLLLG